MRRLRVTVLMGGPSKEREVSLRSGAAVMRALSATGAIVTEVDVRGGDFELPANTDVAFLALHGTFGEDGTVQRILEDRGVVYTGSDPDASALAFDKVAAKAAFAEAGIPTPPETRTPPLVVKPARQGSSVGVTIVRDESELAAAFAAARRYDESVITEQFISGREFTVGVLNGHELPVIEIRTKRGFFDYKAKYTPGEADEVVPRDLDPNTVARMQHLARGAHDCLRCRDFSRVDLMMDSRRDLFVLEVNTLPGLTENSLLPKAAAAAGLSMTDLCMRMVDMALARRPVCVAVAASCR
jgi:D-alanine-D-alanine ligase